jgi:predicted nucleotidyltransferase
MAVSCGADLVVELPAPYALSSAEGFARAGVYILDKLGFCDYISFGSEAGDIGVLREAAEAIVSDEADEITREWLGRGLSYASAQQKAADALMGEWSEAFKSPNNLLGIEYIKAVSAFKSSLKPITVKRAGGEHDGDTGFSASLIRKLLLSGGEPWELMPRAAAEICLKEINAGRGPVSMKHCEIAVLSRLRAAVDFSLLPGASEGLDRRFLRYAASEPTVAGILEKVKTKRYAMSRLRRLLMCACLGITADDTLSPPPYIRVLAMNRVGMGLLKSARKLARLPIITKPASVHRLHGRAAELFYKEAAATDFYVLAYPDEGNRHGGQEWRQSPAVVECRV